MQKAVHEHYALMLLMHTISTLCCTHIQTPRTNAKMALNCLGILLLARLDSKGFHLSKVITSTTA